MEDESNGYVMSNYLIFKVALECPATDVQLVSLCKGGIFGDDGPPLVRKYSTDILKLLNEAVMPEPTLRKMTQVASNTVYTFTPDTVDDLDMIDQGEISAPLSSNQKAPLSAVGSNVYRAAGWINPSFSQSEDEEALHVAEQIRRDLAQRPMLPLVQRIFRQEKEAATKRIQFPGETAESKVDDGQVEIKDPLSTKEESATTQHVNDSAVDDLNVIYILYF